MAAAVAAIDPTSITGFYYHPRMIGLVHLVTLGWMTGSIIGSFFIVGPLALRTPMPARRLDYWAFAFFSIGVAGLVSHFWIEEFSGMAWSAGMVLAAFVQFSVRVFSQLRVGKLPNAVALHIRFALVNLVVAAAIGVLMGADREADVMPGTTLGNVYGHAHLAAIGWAVMMVVGVGYRMLPMVLPSAMPSGVRVSVSAWLIEVGVAGLLVALLLARDVAVFALIVSGGFVAFLMNVGWMARHRTARPNRSALSGPDWGGRQVVQSLVYFGLAIGFGLWIALTPTSASTARLAMLYGVLGLLGFLSQLIVGIEARVLRTAWHRAGIFWLWAAAVPSLATGLTLEDATWVRAGGALLVVAEVLHGLSLGLALRFSRDS